MGAACGDPNPPTSRSMGMIVYRAYRARSPRTHYILQYQWQHKASRRAFSYDAEHRNIAHLLRQVVQRVPPAKPRWTARHKTPPLTSVTPPEMHCTPEGRQLGSPHDVLGSSDLGRSGNFARGDRRVSSQLPRGGEWDKGPGYRAYLSCNPRRRRQVAIRWSLAIVPFITVNCFHYGWFQQKVVIAARHKTSVSFIQYITKFATRRKGSNITTRPLPLQCVRLLETANSPQG